MENILEYIGQKWEELTSFSKKEVLKNDCWKDLVEHYSGPYRFYHNLRHIASLFKLTDQFAAELKTPLVTGFAIMYHDVVYDTFKQDNEEESAALARKHLRALQVKEAVIQQVERFILATKTHALISGEGQQTDLPLFLDIDLAILGAPWDDYEEFSKQVRQEYRQYPEAVYRAGRKNALEQLNDKGQLYHTSHFKNLFEERARQNIFREIQLLS